MEKYLVYYIVWDSDNPIDLEYLPNQLIVDADESLQGDELVEYLGNAITEEVGFCCTSFLFEEA